jgi:hypothetical protein
MNWICSQNYEKRLLGFKSVRPTVRMKQLGSNRMDSREISYLSVFPKTEEKIQVPLKSDTKNGYFT